MRLDGLLCTADFITRLLPLQIDILHEVVNFTIPRCTLNEEELQMLTDALKLLSLLELDSIRCGAASSIST